jgi:hypothetical protein
MGPESVQTIQIPKALKSASSEESIPKTVEMATRITMTRRNSGSNTPPLRLVIYRHTISEIFPEILDPKIPPINGARYNNPTLNDDNLYGLVIRSYPRHGVRSLKNLSNDF